MTTADIFNVGRVIRGPANPDGTPGRTYTLRKPTQYEQGEFQRWLEQRAHDAVDRGSASEAAKDRRHHAIDIDAGLGKYEYDGELGLAARFTPAGMVKIIAIVLRDQDVTEATAEPLVAHCIREIAAEMIEKEESDPNAVRLARIALGLGNLNDPAASGSSSSSSATRPSDAPPTSTPSAGSPTTNCSSSTPSSAAPAG